jgi:hypothetical protein
MMIVMVLTSHWIVRLYLTFKQYSKSDATAPA